MRWSATLSLLLFFPDPRSTGGNETFLSFTRQPEFDDLTANHTVARDHVTGTALSAVDCGGRCGALPWCNSFFFNQLSGLCDPKSAVWWKPPEAWAALQGVVTSHGTRYFVADQAECSRQDGLTHDRVSGLCWTVMRTLLNWTKANSSCQSNRGQRLLVLDTARKMDIVLTSLPVQTARSCLFVGEGIPTNEWGGDYAEDVSDFFWMSGTPVNTSENSEYWKRSALRVSTNRTVIAACTDAGHDYYQLRTFYPYVKRTFLCEKVMH